MFVRIAIPFLLNTQVLKKNRCFSPVRGSYSPEPLLRGCGVFFVAYVKDKSTYILPIFLLRRS